MALRISRGRPKNPDDASLMYVSFMRAVSGSCLSNLLIRARFAEGMVLELSKSSLGDVSIRARFYAGMVNEVAAV